VKSKKFLVISIASIFMLSAMIVVTGCAAPRKATLKAEVGVIEGVSKRLPLKAALYVSDATKAYSYIALIPLGAWEYKFGEHVTKASSVAFLQVFESMAVIQSKRDLDRFDVIIEPEFAPAQTKVDIGYSAVTTRVGLEYRVSDRDGVFWQHVFVGQSTTGGKITDMGEADALPKAVESAALQMWKDFNNRATIGRLYAKRTSPSDFPAEEKTEASPELFSVKSDIDDLPAVKIKPNKNAYAIVIGIENYRQKLPKAAFAASDAKLMRDYLIRVLGYPEENVITLLNDRALKSDLEKYIDRWLINNVESNGRVFIYYSGHGAPNAKTGDAYLVPYDGDPTFIAETGYPIARLYESLGKLKAGEITVILDSCFSGAGGRSVLAAGAKPLVMTINMPVIRRNMSVLTASAGDQISSAYAEKGHGLLTYFLLKGIKNEDVVKPDGSVKMDDLFGYVKPQVERIARKQFNNEQTPQLMTPVKGE